MGIDRLKSSFVRNRDMVVTDPNNFAVSLMCLMNCCKLPPMFSMPCKPYVAELCNERSRYSLVAFVRGEVWHNIIKYEPCWNKHAYQTDVARELHTGRSKWYCSWQNEWADLVLKVRRLYLCALEYWVNRSGL